MMHYIIIITLYSIVFLWCLVELGIVIHKIIKYCREEENETLVQVHPVADFSYGNDMYKSYSQKMVVLNEKDAVLMRRIQKVYESLNVDLLTKHIDEKPIRSNPGKYSTWIYGGQEVKEQNGYTDWSNRTRLTNQPEYGIPHKMSKVMVMA